MATLIITIVLLSQLWDYEINGRVVRFFIFTALSDMLIYLWMLHWILVWTGVIADY